MNTNELAIEVTRMSLAITRCLRYLSEELPESRRGDYLVLLNDVQSKYSRLAAVAGNDLPPTVSGGGVPLNRHSTN